MRKYLSGVQILLRARDPVVGKHRAERVAVGEIKLRLAEKLVAERPFTALFNN